MPDKQKSIDILCFLYYIFLLVFCFLLTQDLLLSNSEGSDSELSESEQLQIMMELQYKRKKKWRKRLKRDPKVLQCT